jgi:hypothetical protein
MQDGSPYNIKHSNIKHSIAEVWTIKTGLAFVRGLI